MTYIQLVGLWNKRGKDACIKSLKCQTDTCLNELYGTIAWKIEKRNGASYCLSTGQANKDIVLNELNDAITGILHERNMFALRTIDERLKKTQCLVESGLKEGGLTYGDYLSIESNIMSMLRHIEGYRRHIDDKKEDRKEILSHAQA